MFRYRLTIILLATLTVALPKIASEIPFYSDLIKNHPELKALEHMHKSRLGESAHKKVYPDPKIGIAYRNYPYNSGLRLYGNDIKSPPMAGVEYSISQEIPFPGKLTLEEKISKLSTKEFSEYKTARTNSLLSDFSILLIRLITLEKKLELNKELRKLYDSIEKVSQASFISGKSNLSGIYKYRSAKAEIQDREVEYRSSIEAIEKEISYYQERSDMTNGYLNFLLSLEELFKGHTKNLHDLTETSAYYKQVKYNLERARAEEKRSFITHFPDTEIFFAYMKRKDQKFVLDSGPLDVKIMDTTEYRGDLMSFGLTMRVPVWSMLNKSDLDMKEEENIKSVSMDLEKTRKKIHSDLEKLSILVKGAESQIALHKKILIPEMEKALRTTSSLYKSGKAEITEVLQNRIDIVNAHIKEEEFSEKKYASIVKFLEISSILYSPVGKGTEK